MALAQAAVWVCGVIVSFLLPPPVDTPRDGQSWVRFAQFSTAIVIGLVLLAAFRWKLKSHAFRWGGVSLGCLILGTVAFFSYQLLVARWTVPYDEQPKLIGSSLTGRGQQIRAASPERTNEQLLNDVAGQVEKVWTRNSVIERRLILAAVYVAAMPLFTICLIAITQAIQCMSIERKRRKRAGPVAKAAT